MRSMEDDLFAAVARLLEQTRVVKSSYGEEDSGGILQEYAVRGFPAAALTIIAGVIA
jgi:hypothetical protein